MFNKMAYLLKIVEMFNNEKTATKNTSFCNNSSRQGPKVTTSDFPGSKLKKKIQGLFFFHKDQIYIYRYRYERSTKQTPMVLENTNNFNANLLLIYIGSFSIHILYSQIC